MARSKAGTPSDLMTRKWLIPFLCATALLFLFTVWTGQIPLWSSDEGRYGNIAREMWETRDFIVPHFWGMEYLEKPVLAPLLTAVSYALFGVHEFTTRSIPILAALLGLLFTFFFNRKIFDESAARLSVLILGTTVGYVLVGRFAVIDMLMTLFLSIACFSFLTAYLTRQRNYYLLAYTAMGLAFLTKGLIGMVLPLGIYFLFLLASRQLQEIKSMKLGWGLLILLLLIVPWMVLISLKEPDFFDIFIVEHHFKRFLTGSFGRKRPFWFFIPIFFATAIPWSFFLPAALGKFLKEKQAPERNKVLFFLIWIMVIFVFFSIPKSKLPYYLLPLSPAVASFLGIFFSSWLKSASQTGPFLKRTWLVLTGFLFFAGLALSLFSFGLWIFPLQSELVSLRLIFLVSGFLFIFSGALLRYFEKRNRRLPLLLVLGGMVYGFCLLTFYGMIVLTPYQSTAAYAQTMREEARPGDLIGVYSSPDKFSDLPFYLKHPIVIIGSDRGTLKIASDRHPEYERHFMSLGNLARLFKDRKQRILCLLAEKKLKDLEREGISEFKVVKRGYGKILISNL